MSATPLKKITQPPKINGKDPKICMKTSECMKITRPTTIEIS